MGQLIDMSNKLETLEVRGIPPNLLPGEVLTEYVRQTYHLFRGMLGERKTEAVGHASLALWCLRHSRRFKTMQCALFSEKSDGPILPVLKEILHRKNPDAATIRIIGSSRDSSDRRSRPRIIGRYLLLSLGQDVSLELIPLSGDFESFLGALGKKTRSHTRSSLRTFDRGGYGYRFECPAKLETSPEIRELAARNMPYAPEPERLEIQTNYSNQQKMPFQSTLSAPDGTSISVIRGYLIDGHAALVDQMNPETYPKIGQTGPSLLHRALLIRALLERGMQGLIVTGGCGGMLSRYCRQVPFDSYLALSLNPLALFHCLRYLPRAAAMGRWALGRFLRQLASPIKTRK